MVKVIIIINHGCLDEKPNQTLRIESCISSEGNTSCEVERGIAQRITDLMEEYLELGKPETIQAKSE